MVFAGRKFVSLLLLIAVLILPLGSLAQGFAPLQAVEDCVCAMPTDASPAGESEEPVPGTDNGCGDCCEGEESGSELAEPRCAQRVMGHLSAAQIYHTLSPGFIPKVYLSIFVPPES